RAPLPRRGFTRLALPNFPVIIQGSPFLTLSDPQRKEGTMSGRIWHPNPLASFPRVWVCALALSWLTGLCQPARAADPTEAESTARKEAEAQRKRADQAQQEVEKLRQEVQTLKRQLDLERQRAQEAARAERVARQRAEEALYQQRLAQEQALRQAHRLL